MAWMHHSRLSHFIRKMTGQHHEQNTALIHITHWKAGSQWVLKILERSARWRVIKVKNSNGVTKILPGKIYSALYLTYDQYQKLELPEKYKTFVVIRDLRDTLISFYFSLKVNHATKGYPEVIKARNELRTLNLEEGLHLTLEWLADSAAIQQSWLNRSETIFRYEDLLNQDMELLLPLIGNATQIREAKIKKAIMRNRFERLTKGRKRGDENLRSHERKAMPGDWKNYFTDLLKKDFKARYGDLLIKSGYESDYSW